MSRNAALRRSRSAARGKMQIAADGSQCTSESRAVLARSRRVSWNRKRLDRR
jgi:hypothetical protein